MYNFNTLAGSTNLSEILMICVCVCARARVCVCVRVKKYYVSDWVVYEIKYKKM